MCKFQLHPDSNQGDPNAQTNFVRLNEAYTFLSDPKKRADYDGSVGLRHKRGGRSDRSIRRNMFEEEERKNDLSHHDLMQVQNACVLVNLRVGGILCGG